MKNRHFFAAISAAAALIGSASAGAATSPEQAQYDKQKAACLAGQSNQDKATCLKEAGAALEEAKRGNLNDGNANYRRNQADRCKALSGSEQTDCVARMRGSGTVSGSVGAGGILREKTTTTTTTSTVSPGGVTIAPQAATPLPAPVTASGPK